jgi:hypothetical protein
MLETYAAPPRSSPLTAPVGVIAAVDTPFEVTSWTNAE